MQDSTSDTSRSSEAGIQQAPFPARPSDKKSVAVGEEISKAAELLATNRLREAARAYRQLASRFPQERVFELIASILERESRCEPENGWGDGGCG